MASSSGVQQQHQQHQASVSGGQQQQQQQQQRYPEQEITPYHCKDCGIYLNSAESLSVHFRYHKDVLMNKWATQASAASHPPAEETNNNTTKVNIKREFIQTNNTVAAAADSSDSMNKKSPDYGNNRTTPDGLLGHPPTPQSYQSASSPYQNNDNSTFSPGYHQNLQQHIKNEPTSPVSHYQGYHHNFTDPQYFQIDSNHQQQQYPSQDYPNMHKSFRFHPYNQQQGMSPYGERAQAAQSQVSSSSPAYPPQPTPSPSPRQCDKCGLVCDTAVQLVEHINMAHPAGGYQGFGIFGSEHPQVTPKTEEDAQSEILDLDSHKVHQVYQPEDEKRQNGEGAEHNPHSVSALLNSWNSGQGQPQTQQQKMFAQEQHAKMFQADQKLFQPHPHHGQDFMGNGVTTTTTQDAMNPLIQQPTQSYRPFEHLPPQPTPPVISSTQVPTNTPVAPPSTKSANWKSNEARRPKTYNCTACNKWFTSSGHLKRHYNTTLHKNAVKSSGQPDPATMPISAHHHPARESASRDDSSGSPGDESRGEETTQFERVNVMSGLLQQPPNGPYDRQPPPNIHHTPPLGPLVNASNLNGGSPNGEAGPSPASLDSRGLLISTTPNTMGANHGYMPTPMMASMDGHHQFQMYPNGLAPHVTQATVISSLNTTTGEELITVAQTADQPQPLPSFSQIHSQRYGGFGYGNASVGGGGSATAPFTFYQDHYELSEQRTLICRNQTDEYKLTILGPAPSTYEEDTIIPYPPSPDNMSPEMDHNNESFVTSDDQISTMEDVKVKLELSPQSPPEEAKFQRELHEISGNMVVRFQKLDYEDHVSTNVVTSTVQLKQAGVHKCYECDKNFNKACYLTQHNKTFHSGDKPFKCGRCGKRFSNEDTYKEHHSKHAGEKPHKCELCPKQFNHKTDLRRHMCLHTGQKPYSCETCGKGFIRKDHMLKHCETHLKKTMPKSRS